MYYTSPQMSERSESVHYSRLEDKDREGRNSSTIRRTTRNGDTYEDYLMAIKRVYHHTPKKVSIEMMPPRERYRQQEMKRRSTAASAAGGSWDMQQATRISTLVSMVPDEIIYKHKHTAVRSYETALMFIDVSGFTELCETYTKAGRGGPSKLTQVLNSYIGAMVQEILAHNGDVLKFSGDAFLSMWKKTSSTTMPQAVHTAIDCGLIIQKNYGTHVTDVGVKLKVKVAISAGVSYFSIIGDEESMAHYVIIGQPVWDVKMAEYMSTAGDVLTAANVWTYVNETEYCTHPCGDGRHTKVLGVGVTWKRVEKMGYVVDPTVDVEPKPIVSFEQEYEESDHVREISYRAFALRPTVISALRGTWWPTLRRFMLPPVIRAVDNDEPMDFLTEIRHVVVVFVNIITKPVSEDVLIEIVDSAYKCVCRLTSESGGLVNKISMFDKDMMLLVCFGLRGFKCDDEVQKALTCAAEMKANLNDPNISSVSIGITSGTTYCGVVGHVLRREYTVIGPAVNKAARIMMAYYNRVTCDKETFVRSKLPLHFFKLMDVKKLKGIANPGPIYEFNKSGFTERLLSWKHPILGRGEEMHKFKRILQNVMKQRTQGFTRFRDHKYGIILMGPSLVGKTRLMQEFLYISPRSMRLELISLTESDNEPYKAIRMILHQNFPRASKISPRDKLENTIRENINTFALSPLEIHALNTIFDCRFPLPEKFTYTGDLLNEFTIKQLVYLFAKSCLPPLRVGALKEVQYMDKLSWRMLLMFMETKNICVIMSCSNESQLSDVALNCIANEMIVKMNIVGIDRWYQGAVACQLLDVQAIPPDLEKVIESASNGNPGWIQNFLISLIQRGELTVVTVPRSEAVEAGSVLPSTMHLQSENDSSQSLNHPDLLNSRHVNSSFQSFRDVPIDSKYNSVADNNNMIQMAVLPDSYTFENIKADVTMDVVILQTYDSLTPFEKMLLKCASVIGDTFTRRMLLYVLDTELVDFTRKFAQAVAKLFKIRVLECEGGDFTRDTSRVIIHAAPMSPDAVPPFCSCVGINPPHDCRDLPQYAFCGYMKFKHSLFKKTTYDLLTENQKHEMHSRARLYLERNTRRCISCGGGCFYKLFGVRYDDGMVQENPDVRRTRLQMAALSAESRIASDTDQYDIHCAAGVPDEEGTQFDDRRISDSNSTAKATRIRSFSSLEMDKCECLAILLSVYTEIVNHLSAVGDCYTLFEVYIEFADLSLINLNIPQALRLLKEAEVFLSRKKLCRMDICKIEWIRDYRMARILTMRAGCMYGSGDLDEAKKNLLTALQLLKEPFPSTKLAAKLRNVRESFNLAMAIYVMPRCYVGTQSLGLIGEYYEDISRTMSKLFRVFSYERDHENASLAAKIAFNYCLRTNATFRLMCVCYGNLISVYREKRKYCTCRKLEKLAVELCHRKRGELDVTEVYAVCTLYTNIFLFYNQCGKKVETLEYGLSAIPLITIYADLTSCQLLVLLMLKALLSEGRLHEMVLIMREFFYMADHYDSSSETWYYYYAMVILLDTGYCVETYSACEQFYVKKGDVILRSKTPEAAWNFFIAMWLVAIRIGSWERSILWQEKINEALAITGQPQFQCMILTRTVEGKMILMVNEMNKRNSKKVEMLENNISELFRLIKRSIDQSPFYKPRTLLLWAYFHYIKGKKSRAFKILNDAYELAKFHTLNTIQIWIQHTYSHWKDSLNKRFVNYWMEHIEIDNILDYKTFDSDKMYLIPYTLPIPNEF